MRLPALLLAALSIAACTRNSDDAFVASAQRVRPAVVLLKMKIPPEHRNDKYDEAYATGFVIASGGWGSDVLTVAHAIDGAWDLSITVDNRQRAPARVVASNADLDVALLRTSR
jgi:S1-C subfamily serine protease